MRPRRRGLLIVKTLDGQILASCRRSTDHLHCVEVPVLAGGRACSCVRNKEEKKFWGGFGGFL